MDDMIKEIQIAQGWVSHHRKNKKDLSFKYDIFNVLIPESDLNNEIVRFKGFPYLKIKSKDYLENKNIPLNLAVHNFLKSKMDYSCDNVILQTMPRMFGYGFNPISFWFCYLNTSLDAVLCEVNNTFGERHFYFLKLTEKNKFYTLDKSFHVSPFLKIEGYYDFKFDINEDKNTITINYFKDKQTLLLSTKISLDIKPFNSISPFQLLHKYKWMTVMVIVRIHYLALKLWFKKIPFIKKPQPPLKDVTYDK